MSPAFVKRFTNGVRRGQRIGTGRMALESGRSVLVTPRDRWDTTFEAEVPLFDGQAFSCLQGASGSPKLQPHAIGRIEDVLFAVLRAYHEALSA